MTVNRSKIKSLLEPGLNKVFGDWYYKDVDELAGMFEVESSNRSFEEEVGTSGLHSAPVKLEGEAIEYDDVQETYKTRYTHETIALGFAITEEAVEDNLYVKPSMIQAKALATAMKDAKQVKGANVYNNAFSSSYVGGDGVSLCNASHPLLGGGTASNVGSADLSETSLENALNEIALYTNDRDILIGAMGEKLIIPQQLFYVANKILRSDLSTTPLTGTNAISNANDINVLRSNGMLPGGIHVNRRLTDNNAWFIKTNVDNGLKHFERAKLSTKMEGDFDTGNVRYKARERYSFGWSDWKGIWGSTGS